MAQPNAVVPSPIRPRVRPPDRHGAARFNAPSLARLIAAAAGLAGMIAGSACAQPSFTDLGVLSFNQQSHASGVSGDGDVVVGTAQVGGNWVAFRWTRAGGMVNMGLLPGGNLTGADQASFYGSVIVGSGSTPQTRPWWWAGGSLNNMGTLPGLINSAVATGVSDDGSVIVGYCNGSSPTGGITHPFRWTIATGMVDMGVLPGSSVAAAENISGDGRVVVGYGSPGPTPTVQHAIRWEDGVIEDLGVVEGRPKSMASDVSYNGSVVVGTTHDAAGLRNVMRWTRAGGMQNLGTLNVQDFTCFLQRYAAGCP